MKKDKAIVKIKWKNHKELGCHCSKYYDDDKESKENKLNHSKSLKIKMKWKINYHNEKRKHCHERDF